MFGRFKPERLKAELKPSGFFSRRTGAQVVDLSETGVGLRVFADIPPGRRVKVFLVNGDARTHRLCGTVRYSGAEPGGSRRLDVHFEAVDLEERAWIRSLRS
jgi:hypothetical protein